MSESIGKKAEKKLQEWLDKPSEGYSFDRIKDQMTQPDFLEVQTYLILNLFFLLIVDCLSFFLTIFQSSLQVKIEAD